MLEVILSKNTLNDMKGALRDENSAFMSWLVNIRVTLSRKDRAKIIEVHQVKRSLFYFYSLNQSFIALLIFLILTFNVGQKFLLIIGPKKYALSFCGYSYHTISVTQSRV